MSEPTDRYNHVPDGAATGDGRAIAFAILALADELQALVPDVAQPRFAWVSDSLCVDVSRVVSAKVQRAPLPRYAGQFLGGRRDVVLTLDTGKEYTVIAVDEDRRRRDFESHEPADQRDRVESATRAWIDDLLTARKRNDDTTTNPDPTEETRDA